MKEPLHVHAEPTIDEMLCDEVVQAMMAADRVDRYALAAMLAEVAQTLSARRCRSLPSGSWSSERAPLDHAENR